MTSTSIYIDQSYVVYHITYLGDKLPSKKDSDIIPANYIGSTSIKQINKGYMGTVKSKNYKKIWKSELKYNPNLFKLEIISYHDTRSDATWKELQIQKIFNVVTNPLFVNLSLAQPNGYFGMDMQGKNNPMFGSSRKKETNPFYNKIHSNETKDNMSKFMVDYFKNNKNVTSNTIWINNGYINKRLCITKQIPLGFYVGLLQIQCPHCNLIGGSQNMKRYHFNKCKLFNI